MSQLPSRNAKIHDFAEVGRLHGRYGYVDPPSGTVVVTLSEYGIEQDEQETVGVFRATTGVTQPRNTPGARGVGIGGQHSEGDP
ncbi:hypothetical protein [Nocardia sp. R6R-6]|uniref:hypothetical protein n=1 Tax=Nocardia sp. R6R-6 TaxID=3459303 RepID=UPI00403D5C93